MGKPYQHSFAMEIRILNTDQIPLATLFFPSLFSSSLSKQFSPAPCPRLGSDSRQGGEKWHLPVMLLVRVWPVSETWLLGLCVVLYWQFLLFSVVSIVKNWIPGRTKETRTPFQWHCHNLIFISLQAFRWMLKQYELPYKPYSAETFGWKNPPTLRILRAPLIYTLDLAGELLLAFSQILKCFFFNCV